VSNFSQGTAAGIHRFAGGNYRAWIGCLTGSGTTRLYATLSTLMLAALLVATQNEAWTFRAPGSIFWGLVVVLINPMVCWIQVRLAKRRFSPMNPDETRWDEQLNKIERRQFCFWLASSWLFYLGSDWAQQMSQLFGNRSLTVIGELAILLPTLIALLANQYPLSAWAQRPLARKLFWFRLESLLRLVFAFMILPLCFHALGQQIFVNWENFSTTTRALTLAGALALFVFLPRIMLQLAFATRPLNAQLATYLNDRFARERTGFQVSFAMWDSKGCFCNALVLPSFRGRVRILFSDLLLEFFEPSELTAIAKHELAHASRNHFLFRLAAILLPFGFLAMADVAGTLELFARPSAQSPLQITFVGMMVVVVASLAAAYLFRIVAFNNEFEADRVAVQLHPATNVVNGQSVDELLSALQKMACIFPAQAERRSFTHPSLMERIKRLKKMKYPAYDKPFIGL
jgi:Zn-dependent protease with chaperone function